MDLSLNIRAIVSQGLLPSVDGERIPAVEVMLISPCIQELIIKGHIGEIKEAMKESPNDCTVTFDQALLESYNEWKITQEEAFLNADSKNDLNLAIRMDKHEAADEDNELIIG